MAMFKLNPKQCAAAKPKPDGKDATYPDGGGLYLLVQQKPDRIAKYWRYAFRINGKLNRMGFGTFPDVTLEQARAKHREARKMVQAGIDPVERNKEAEAAKEREEMRREADAENTFEKIARRMIAAKTGKITEMSQKKFLRSFEIHIFPKFGDRHITAIESREWLALFRDIATEKSHEGFTGARTKTYLARKLCERVNEVYNFAQFENPDFDRNPCRNMVKHLPEHSEQHMRRIAFEALPAFVQSLEGYAGDDTKAAIWLLLYTGMRQASVRRATWSDFDLKAGVWYRKPEKQDKGALPLPLPRQAVAMLKGMKGEAAAGDFVFNGIKKGSPLSEMTINRALTRLGVDMVGHGLRGLVTTGLNELRFSPHLVEKQVGHLPGKVEAAYNHSQRLEERREMMQRWADYLDGLKNDQTPKGQGSETVTRRTLKVA